MRRHFFNNKIGEKIDLSKPYFAIEALEDGLTVKLSINACEYCIDNGEWKTLARATNTMIINNGQTLSFRGNLTPTSSMGIGTFTISKKCNVKGNVMSLLYKDEFEEQTDLTGKNYAVCKLFYKCTNIVNASELILPATTLADNCYEHMFDYCTSLVTTPALPATTLAKECYDHMFIGCSSLTTAPVLPATTLANYCYSNMFSGCTSLTTAPSILPATTLNEWCYNRMFYGCTSLVTAPELPATTLTENCYTGMFYNCNSLNYIKALFTTKPSFTYTNDWVNGVSSTGTFIKNATATWNVTGNAGIPEGWTVEIDGGSTSNLISFTMLGVSYQAEEGMTWGEWVNSKYNTCGAYILSNGKITLRASDFDYIYNTTTDEYNGVYKTDIIQNNHQYNGYGGSGGD